MKLNFAENMKRLRKEKGITQETLAEQLGVSSQSVSRWELSICYPDLEMLPSIANFFGVTVDVLLCNDADSKEKDEQFFNEMFWNLSDETTEKIDFMREYCRKYPENDTYAYFLVVAIQRHVIGDAVKTEKYMPLLLKNAERLLETRYRNAVIQNMVCLCDEKELSKWLDMTPYAGFSRRYCLISRAMARDEKDNWCVQQGMEMLETFAEQLDRRCPDSKGPKLKAEYQRSVLRTVESFGVGREVPDGWKMFYAYKQLVLAACLFGQKKYDEGWKEFDAAIATCKYIFSLKDEWLDIGGSLFANLKVSKDWNYAIDQNGNKHKLFAIVNLSFYDMTTITDLLTSTRWAWFHSVRSTEKFQATVAWVKEMEKKQNEEL